MRKRNYHSRSYHKFFEDWAELRRLDENGKIHVERVYVGKYYRSPLTIGQRIARQLLYVFLYGLSIALFVIGGIRDIPVNHSLIPSLFVAICIFPLAWLILPLFRNLTMPKEMIIRQYRAASLDLIRISGIASGALAVAALVTLLFLVTGKGWLRETVGCALCYLVAAGLLFALRFLEQRLKYEVLPPRTSRPENSTIIEFESAVQRF